MKTIALLTLLLCGTVAVGQSDSCANASPFTWYACEDYEAPYPQSATLCYSFTTNGTSVNFDFGYFAFCPDLTVTYTLYSAACDSLMTNTTGAFAIASGVPYTICGTVACGSPGGIKTVCTTEQMTLPVELVSVTGYPTDVGVVLSWTTASEFGTRAFTIHRSLDYREWKELGEVAAAGNSVGRREYRWTDTDPCSGTAYYRLDGEDLDGHIRTLMILPVWWERVDRSSLGHFDLLGREVK